MRTYVVRIWVPAEDEPAEELRGTVFDVSAGTERTFAGHANLLDTLRGAHGQQPRRRRGDEDAVPNTAG